jgi:tRNA (mo5U34)-methyltransferase
MESVSREEANALVKRHRWWYHKFEIYPGIWTPGVYDPSGILRELKLPDDMRGMRVLEIGPADGYFTKMLCARGAKVVAVDYAAKDYYGFEVMERLAQVAYDFRHCNLFDIDPSSLGAFDVILCLGVLYHLPDPLRGLWILSNILAPKLILDTLVSTKYGDECVAEFIPDVSPNGDYTNFWAPTTKCCEMMLGDVGYKVDSIFRYETRSLFRCSIDRNNVPTKKMRTAYTKLAD